MMVFRAASVLLAGIVCVSLSSPTIAKECLTPKAMALMVENYKSYCVANVQELTAMLRLRKTKVQKTGKLAHIAYKDLLKCDFQTDPLLKKIKNQDNVVETEKAINEQGLKFYIVYGEDSLAKTRTKYRIDELEQLASSKIGLSEDEVLVLAAFAKTKAKSGAVLAALRACDN